MDVRPARADEIDAIFQVHRDSVTALCAEHYTAAQIAMWLEGREPSMYLAAIDRGDLWVAAVGGAMAGFVEIDGHEICKLFVRGEQAGGGVGRRLLTTATDAIRAAGHATAYLESTRNARAFYEGHGFVPTGTGTFSRGASGVMLEVVTMERAL